MDRRAFLRFSVSGALGLSGFSGLAHLASAAPATKLKPVIFLFLSGGPPRQETFDPCLPDAPVEYRGVRTRIATTIPSVHFSDYWPRLARVADKCALLRGVDSQSGDHATSTRNLVLGTEQNTLGIRWGDRAANGGPPYMFVQVPSSYSVMNEFQPTQAMVSRWKRTAEGRGESEWEKDLTSSGNYVGPELRQDPRLPERRALLQAFDTARIESPAVSRHDANTRLALELLSGGGGAFSQAFRLPPREVERYGANVTGKALLLARQLVRAGAGFVVVYHERGMGWDVHDDMYNRLTTLAGETDEAASALITDIDRGQVDCLFVMGGEFGRTPKVNTNAGRDHWGEGFPILFSGARTRSGVVHGRTHHSGKILDGQVPAQQIGSTIVALCGGDEFLNPATQRVREVIR